MKFLWFHQMTWPDLPEDIDLPSQGRSVWVTPDPRHFDRRRGHELYNEWLDQWEYAETLGFDGVLYNEHHQSALTGISTPNMFAAAVARRTSKIAIALVGNEIALYGPPLRVAEELAMLDLLSGGRVIAGFPVGIAMDSNWVYGVPPGTLRARYREAHDLILRAWTEDGPFAFNGKYTKLRYVNTWQRPVQVPHPPIWIPGGGSIETWQFAVEHDYNWSYLSDGGYGASKLNTDAFWEAVAARGKDESPYRVAYAQSVLVADSDAEAERLYAEHVDYQARAGRQMLPRFGDAPGYRSVQSIKRGLGYAGRGAVLAETYQQRVEAGALIAGGPETVRQRMEEMITSLRCGTVICIVGLGNMPDWKIRHSAGLLAEKVLPKLRGLWPEWDHDDRFWCKPLEDRVNPLDTIGGKTRVQAPAEAELDASGHVSAWSRVETARGASVRVLELGAGPPLVFLHGEGGIDAADPLLERLAAGHKVYAPELPGWGESEGEELLEEMLDFALHGWDVVDALGLERPTLVGQSLGGMIAAEMAALCPERVAKLALLAPFGLWLDEHPLPDIFALPQEELDEFLFHAPERSAAPPPDLDDEEARTAFQVARSRSLGTASKFMFPIPERGLATRLYRLRAETLLLWGESDRLVPPVYAARWLELLPNGRLVTVADAGHLAQAEQTDRFAAELETFLAPPA